MKGMKRIVFSICIVSVLLLGGCSKEERSEETMVKEKREQTFENVLQS